jgi:NAD(P)H-nitrite reductase large subunit
MELGIDWARAPEEELVCPCAGVSKARIREAIAQGAYTLALVKILTGAGREDACRRKNPRGRSCHPDILELIRIYYDGPPPLGGGCGL